MSETEEHIIESLIVKINKEGGFTTPDAYFDAMKSSILSKIDNDRLTIHKPENGFVVPEAFFETQKHQILSKAIKPQVKKISLTYGQLMMGAASIAAIITIVGFLFLKNNSGQSNDLTATISSEEIVNHLEKTDVSEDLICELLNQNKTSKKENEIEKYLNEHADEDLLVDDL